MITKDDVENMLNYFRMVEEFKETFQIKRELNFSEEDVAFITNTTQRCEQLINLGYSKEAAIRLSKTEGNETGN